MHVKLRRERLELLSVSYELQRHEEPQPTHFPNDGVLVLDALQPGAQLDTAHLGVLDQPVLFNDFEHGVADRAGQRVTGVGVAVHEASRRYHRVGYLATAHHCAERDVARAQTLGKRQDIHLGANGPVILPVLVGAECAGAADARHHFVVDDQDAVPPAYFRHRSEVARWWH